MKSLNAINGKTTDVRYFGRIHSMLSLAYCKQQQLGRAEEAAKSAETILGSDIADVGV